MNTAPPASTITGQAEPDPPSAAAAASGGKLARSVFRWLALLGFPASLTTPGATVSMALVAVYGLVLLVREGGLDEDLRRVHRYMLACYLLVLAVDLLNGGGWANLAPVGGYLPLLALAPYAHAVRRLGLTPGHFDLAMQATLALAIVMSVFRYAFLGDPRPGGINGLASVGYGVVVAIWAVFVLSRALARKQAAGPSFAVAAAALVPVLLSQSKIAAACMALGFLAVAVQWAAAARRWRSLLAWLAGLSVPLAAAAYLTVAPRFAAMWSELLSFYADGSLVRGSFGERYEQSIAGWRAFLEEPLLGHGFQERTAAVVAHASPGGPDVSALAYIHNDYVTHLVSFGGFGLVFLVLFFVLTFRLIRASGEVAYRRAGYAVLAMMALYMFVDVVFHMDPMSGALTIALGTVLSVGGREHPAATAAASAIDGKSTKGR